MTGQPTTKLTILLGVACSLLVGASHLIVKAAADRVRQFGWTDLSAGLLLLLSYSLLGIAFVLFLYALRSGALSTLYPVLAARYLWVVALTPVFFATETLNASKIAGAALVAAGVALVAGSGTK